MARDLAETEGWAAVTIRRLASELDVSQPVLYSAFDSRDAVVDAVAVSGFTGIADALHAVDATPRARMRTYLEFAAAHPQVYEAMFSMPSGLAFASADTPEALARAFRGIADAFPGAGGAEVEIAWSVLHGLATLQAGGRLTPGQEQARFELAHRMLTHHLSAPTASPTERDPQRRR